MNYKIYLLTFPNNKKYCGYTSQELKDRWKNGRGYVKCPLVYKAIQKYGWDNVKKELIFETFNQNAAYEKEKEIITKLDLTNPNKGYNMDSGGRPHGATYISPEGRQRISEAHKALWANPDYRAKMKKARKNNKPSQLCIEKSRIATSQRLKGKIPYNVRAVFQIDKNTNQIIKSFISATEASLELIGKKDGCSNILNVCKGKRKTAYGYKWRFKE